LQTGGNIDAVRMKRRNRERASSMIFDLQGRKLVFATEAHDGIDLISKGLHERFIINKERFVAKVSEKKSQFITFR
jgi:predicted thioesterase